VSERGKLQISTETQGFQAKAADPRWSIWVSANAGSGKTFVLTRRVLRLLLTEVAPQSILCLTYTKAAAAEMRRRVAGELARWAVADDATLEKELRAIEGHAFDRKLLKIARTLFAKALETPGGLKIVTIHAFCESVLHRFPLEAGVPFDFKVIEEDERSAMLLAAREAVIAQGLSGNGPAEAALTLFDLLSDFQISEAIALAMTDGRKLKAVLADTDAAKANLRRLVGDSIGNVRDLQARFVADTLLSPLDIREIVQLLDGVPTGKTRIADLLSRLDPDQLDPSGWRAGFFTTTGTPRGLLAAKDRAKYPHIQERLEAEQARLVALDAALGKARLIERSEALLDIVVAIVARYEHHKRARSLLDFDDLVELLGDLLANRALGPWVQYKLDAGIDHILVDESQDTNPEQWRVVRAIADEFFAGQGAVDRPRSLFAVGDQKQSIYSFQGAEPSLFGETGELFERRAATAELAFRRLPLRTSFRTLPEILRAVDLVSDQPGIQDALLETEKVHHDTARTMVGGSVTLWPPVQQAASVSESTDWPTEPATGGDRTAPRQVAERIAQEIRHWIDHKRPLTGRNRAVIADDVLILVQSRGPLFQEIIRALRQYNLPTPGADQLQVTRHIAVMDLLALCDVLLNPADSLQLAALLRSPLFSVSEEDLLALAQPRDKYETLWQALRRSTIASCAEAYAQLSRWRGELDFERPFEFFTHVLYAEGGLKKFHARLGDEVDDVFAELLDLALNHEQGSQPSLQGFVADMRGRELAIKRELADHGAGIRVMTVHGAKGLEAPIVILADAANKPQGTQTSRAVYVVDSPAPMLIHAAGSSQHAAETLELRNGIEANLLKEYWRKLYVAMTRAEDELYVTGPLTPGRDAAKQLENTWYAAIEQALRDDAESLVDAEGKLTALIYPRLREAPQPVQKLAELVPLSALPLHLDKLAPRIEPVIVTPSTVSAERARPQALHALDSLADQVRSADAARQEGIALHALLQHLGRIDPARWARVVPKALEALLPALPERHGPIGAKAISILTRPELKTLFGPHSRAEVPFMVEARRDGEDIRITGRLDRLIIDDSGITLVDYKSDAVVPESPETVPASYLTQLGLYALVASQLFPGQQVRAAILWTQLESLMNLPPDSLAAATSGFTLR
jgi:ATP-dependent helicase/nuclease subunit A